MGSKDDIVASSQDKRLRDFFPNFISLSGRKSSVFISVVDNMIILWDVSYIYLNVKYKFYATLKGAKLSFYVIYISRMTPAYTL